MEGVLFLCTIFLYLVSSILFIGMFSFKREGLLRYAFLIEIAGFLLHSGALIIRIATSGHFPAVGNYENTLTGSWFIILFTITIQRSAGLYTVATATIPFSLLMLEYGWVMGTGIEPLTPPYQTLWLYIHVLFAWLAYGSYTIAFGIAVVYILRRRVYISGIPSLEILDDLMLRYTIFGFITDALMIAAGSIWASRLWGSYWSWDPVEVWSLLSWLIYGNLIHLRLVFGWRGEKVAWYLIFAIITVVVSFWGVNFIMETVHTFKLNEI